MTILNELGNRESCCGFDMLSDFGESNLVPRPFYRILKIALLVTIVLVGVAAIVVWYQSSHAPWQLTAINTPNGVEIEFYEGLNDEPSYKTLLQGRSIVRDVQRVSRLELPAEIGTTTFYDETLRPGAGNS